MASYYSADVKCPFYMHDNVQQCTITCEGFAPGSTVRSHFPNKAMLTRQIEKYCSTGYEACPWYKLAYMKWEE